MKSVDVMGRSACSEVHITIERVVLDGLLADPSQAGLLQAGLEQELAALAAAGQWGTTTSARHEIITAPGIQTDLQRAGAGALGRQIALSLYQNLGEVARGQTGSHRFQ